MSEPIVLIDQPDEELCAERGWVEATLPEDAARDRLISFVYDEDGKQAPPRPCGETKRVWLAPEAGDYVDEARWLPAEPNASGAIEFYEFAVQDAEQETTGDGER